MREYNGGLTREQFLFYEIRIMASLVSRGYTKAEAIEKITEENLFQFPTERMVASIANTCFQRLSALESDALVYHLANATADVTKQISDTKTIIADKTSNNGSERVFRTRFTLKSMEFKKTETYYLTVVEKGTTNVIDKIEFTIDIAFVNDFDF